MFKRRQPLTKLQFLREMFWPSMGWRRAFRYVRLRIMRLADSAHSIALGLAIGFAVSFTPLVGTHFLQAAFFAWLLRGNVLAALIGTFSGNPWTFPFMWWASIQFGSYLFHLFGLPATAALPEYMDFGVLLDLIWHDPLRLFFPWVLGGYILGVLSIPPAYMLFYRLVQAGKIARRKAKLYRIHQLAREVTREHSAP